MKGTSILVLVVILLAACGSTTPVMKVDDLWDEREKSKSEFQKKFFGKEVAAAGRYQSDNSDLEIKGSDGVAEVKIVGSTYKTVTCLIEAKDVEPFKNIAKGTAVAVKGKLVSDEDVAYPELRPCSLVTK